MFSRNHACVWMAIAASALLGTGSARAQQPPCYTTASVAGSWAALATYGANVALAMGKRSIEPSGDFTGTFLLNAPVPGSPTGARTISTGTQVGSYAINCDGTGTVTRTLTASTGVTTTQVDDLVIIKAVMKGGRLIATQMADAVRVPSVLVPGGIFVTRVLTRLPDDEGDR